MQQNLKKYQTAGIGIDAGSLSYIALSLYLQI
jgi:hypothetical protein